MTTEAFIKNFEQFADAPNAVENMRELVLQLAITGKLVPQDPKDEPATKLVERACELAGKGPDALKHKRVIEAWESRDADMSRPLPAGWAWTCNAIIGDTSPRVSAKDDARVAFAPMHLIPTDYRERLKPEIRPWGEIKKGYTHFADGDIAVAKITPCFQNGKACVMNALPGGLGTGTTELHVLRPFPNTVLSLFMLLYFKSPEFVEGGVATFTGTAGQQRVSNDYFRFRPIALPPLAEQRRIVAKVDELMALCDRLEAQQNERAEKHAALARASLARFAEAPTPANLQFLFHHAYTIPPADLRKSILTLAVHGKLVDTDARGWKTTTLDDVAVEIVDCPHSTPKWTPAGKICVRTNQFRPGFLDLSGSRFVSDETFTERIARLRPKEDDILYSREGGILGVACRVPPSAEICLGQRMMLIRAGPDATPRFLELILNSPVITDIARRETTGGAAPRVNVATVKSYPISYPPLAEQRRIVAKVDQLMALVDQLEAQLAAADTFGEQLTEAIVAELTTRE